MKARVLAMRAGAHHTGLGSAQSPTGLHSRCVFSLSLDALKLYVTPAMRSTKFIRKGVLQRRPPSDPHLLGCRRHSLHSFARCSPSGARLLACKGSSRKHKPAKECSRHSLHRARLTGVQPDSISGRAFKHLLFQLQYVTLKHCAVNAREIVSVQILPPCNSPRHAFHCELVVC